MEVHGLKDILVRENDNRVRETEELRIAMELSSQKLGEALERECYDMDQVIMFSNYLIGQNYNFSSILS